MLDWQIRDFASHDLSDLINVIDDVCDESDWMSTKRFVPTAPWLHALESPECLCHLLLVVEDAKRVVGWCRAFPEYSEPGIQQVELGVGLLPEYRDRGIGTTLVRQSLAWASNAGYKRVSLSVHPDNTRAMHLFSRCGFTFVRQTEGNLVEMACNLRGSSGGKERVAVRYSFDDNNAVILFSLATQHTEQDCACADEGFRVLSSSNLEQSETDCACADARWTTPITAPAEDINAAWQIADEIYRAPLPQAHELAITPQAAAGVVVLNETAQAILDSFAVPGPLSAKAAHQLAALGLLQPQGTTFAPAYSPSQTLVAWLHVTNACNLRCTYCYVPKTDEAMEEATGLAAIDAIFRSAVDHGFKSVKLKYAGGEATLNFPLIRLLHSYAQDQATARGLALREVILSNGVGLSHGMLDFIRDADMRLMLSLDGLGGKYDVQRIFNNGRGSSLQVTRNVDRAIAHGIKPHLSITVTRHNAEGIASAVAFALDRELLFNLNFYRDHAQGVSREELMAEDAQLIAGVKTAFRIIEERLPRQSLIAALVDRANFISPHDRPCGAGHSYLVVDHHGRIANCQMEIEHSLTDVSKEDPLAIICQQSTGFSNPSVDEKEGCRDCQWRYWCAGGCPLLTYRATNRSDIKSPYCNVYQKLFPELLRLEGLRLLKWHAPTTI